MGKSKEKKTLRNKKIYDSVVKIREEFGRGFQHKELEKLASKNDMTVSRLYQIIKTFEDDK